MKKEDLTNKKSIITAVISAILLVGMIFALTSCVDKDDMCEYGYERDTDGREIVYVEMSIKDYGKVKLLLDKTTAPVTVENFVSLVNDGFYDGLTFHRIIEDFMIQGGDPEANGSGGSDEDIFGEFAANGHNNDIRHIKGVISMARSKPYNSASSQFFICNADSPHLDGYYAAFGYVVEGLGIVDKVTEDFVKYTYNGVIYDKAYQPVIEYIRVVD